MNPRRQPPEENFRINMRPFMPQAGRSQTATAAAGLRRMHKSTIF